MSKVVTRRERREQLRQQRPMRPQAQPPRRRFGGPLIGLGAIAGAAVIVFALVQLGVFAPGARPADLRSIEPGNEVVGQQFPDEGTTHLGSGERATYKTDPPTSGPHWGAPAGPVAWGTKDTTLPNEAVVHNLEHGGIVIFYKALDAEETAKLKDLVRQMNQIGYPKIVLEPYSTMADARVALSAWRWQLKLSGVDEQQIVKFVKQHYDGPDAPERGVR